VQERRDHRAVSDNSQQQGSQRVKNLDTAALRTVINAVDDIIFVLDAGYRLQYWNGSLESLTGYSADELAGKNALELIPEEGVAETKNKIADILDGATVHLRGKLQAADGTQIPVEYTATRLDRPEQTDLICGVVKDLTAYKKREQRLREQTERFELLTENLDEVVWIREGDKKQVVFISDSYERIWQRSPDELYEDADAFLETIYHEDRDRVTEELTRADTADLDIEYRISRPNGDIRWIHDTAKSVYNEVDESIQIVGIARDITHRKRREDQLNALHDVTQSLIEAESRSEVAQIAVRASDLILGFDKVGLHLYDAETEQLEPIAHTQALERVLGGEPPTFERGDGLIWDAFNSGVAVYHNEIQSDPNRYNDDTPFRNELHVPLAEYGVIVFASTSALPFTHNERSLAELLGANIRSTLRSIEREELIATQRDRLDELLGIISHDIRNPLNIANGRAKMAYETGDVTHLEPVIDAIERVESLTNDLLSLAGGDRDGKTHEQLSLDECVADAWEMIEHEQATLSVEDALPTVSGSESQLRQLFENLFSNAVRHGGEIVSIGVGTINDGFYVEDNGPGIPADVRESVFDMEYSTAEEGTGFGLMIVEQVVENHGWSICIEESKSGGARFEIRFGTQKTPKTPNVDD